MSTAAEKANLARIRDNQRRSRARRKEYLQELEARLRQCELQGIEASSEIQMAARRVADENKKLRSLLAQHGVGNDIVEPYLHFNSEDLIMSTQCGSESTSVQQLEHLLQTRKKCCGDGNGSIGPASATTMQTIQSRESSCSGNTVHSLWDPVHTSRSLSVGQTQTSLVDIKNASPAHQYMESRRSSATSRHSSISISQNHNTGRTIHTQQHQLQLQHQHQQRYNIPMALPNTQQQQSTPSSLSIQTQTSPIYDFDPQYLSSQSYNSISPQNYHMHSHSRSHSHSHSHSHLHSQSHPQPQSHQPHPSHQNPAHSHQTSPPLSTPYTTALSSSSSHPNPSTNANTNNMNSCIFATDLITSISNSDSAIVRAELGCVSGMDCNVDNQLVFNVMDRYTGSGVGL